MQIKTVVQMRAVYLLRTLIQGIKPKFTIKRNVFAIMFYAEIVTICVCMNGSSSRNEWKGKRRYRAL